MISSSLYTAFVWFGVFWMYVGVLTVALLAVKDLPQMFGEGRGRGGAAGG